jgi:hypothetical protein
MKNKINLVILLPFFLIGVSACSKEFINPTPPSLNNAENFFISKEGISQAVIGAYNGLQAVEVSTFAAMMNEERSDNTFNMSVRSTYNDLSVQNFTLTSSKPFLDDAWARCYDVIHRCNLVISNIDNVPFDNDDIKRQYVGEMKVIRGLMYFNLVRYFGGVPIVLTDITPEEAIKVERSTIQQTYDAITKDLRDAIDLLPNNYTGANVGRITRFAAEGLLGRVFLTMSGYPLNANKWNDAKTLFEDIIHSNQFVFFSNYSDIFDLSNENGRQCVFYVQFKAGQIDVGNPIPTRNADNDVDSKSFPFGGSPDAPVVSQNLIDSYEAGDLRFQHDVRMEWKNKSGQVITNMPTIKKFAVGQPTKAGDWDINWPIIRYTDILMMYAECLNELNFEPNGMALEILNMVRSRANITPFSPNDIPNKDVLRDLLIKERRHEFAFENIRWNDLVRTDKGFDVMKSFLATFGLSENFKSRDQYLYPIPLQVIQTTPIITQNEGY